MSDNHDTPDNPPHPPDVALWKFSGFVLPTTTPVPDQFFDELLARLAPTEVVVALYIIRRTFGFKKDSDNISLKQIADGITTKNGRVLDRGTGLSKATIARALKGLEEKGVILRRRRRSHQKGDEPTTYQLHVPGPLNVNGLPPVSQIETPPVSPVRHPRVSELNTQETVLQQTDRQDTDLSNIRLASNFENEKDGPEITPPSATQDVKSGRGFKTVGNVIAQRRRPQPVTFDEDRQAIVEYMTDFSREFGDEAKLSSTVSRAVNLFRRSEVELGQFFSALYEARAKTKEYTANIKKRSVGDTTPYGSKNKMPYFFGVLEQVLGLREDGRLGNDAESNQGPRKSE